MDDSFPSKAVRDFLLVAVQALRHLQPYLFHATLQGGGRQRMWAGL